MANLQNGLELDTLKFNYQLIINTLGLPQLNIYVCYSENDLGIKPKYWDNCFQINFSEHITPKVNLSEIATIEVFLIDEDPRTSRGTVTTVKKPM